MANKMEKNVAPMTVADPLAIFEKEGMLKLVAPAKVNLFLGIGEKQEDGFHSAKTVMHALTLHDVLKIDYEPESAGGLVVEVRTFAREGLEPLEVSSEDNLVYKAIHALAARLDRSQDETIHVRIEKHIPHQAGLGGGSSDAAAGLVGAAKLWGIDPLDPEVVATASELGSDVAFFLHGGCASFEGKGDKFIRELSPMKTPLVLIKPDKGVSTAQAYQVFDEQAEVCDAQAVEQALNATAAEDVPLYNNLAPASQKVLPDLTVVQEWIRKQPEAGKFLLCGSGSATFVMCETMEQACALVGKARNQGWWARSAAFSSIRAAEVPK